jgi:hypothetical protein
MAQAGADVEHAGAGAEVDDEVAEVQLAARVPLAELQELYITAQRYYTRPALAVLSDAQARYYIPGIANSQLARALPDMYRVLTSRTTAPEYFDLLTQSLVMRRRADGDGASPAQLRKAQEQVTAQMLVAIHEAEERRLEGLRQVAAARRAKQRGNRASKTQKGAGGRNR